MPAFLPDELKTRVKQGLRDMRFLAREMRGHVAPAEAPNETGGGGLKPAVIDLTKRLSLFSDGAMQRVESMALGLLSSDPQAHFGAARAYPLDRYTGRRQAAAEAAFARDCYFAAKQILQAKGCDNPRVGEALFAAAYRRGVAEWTIPLGPDASLEVIAEAAAVLSQAILQARPVQAPPYVAQAGGPPLDTGIYVAAAIGLGIAVATYHHDLLTADDAVFPGVCAAVDARGEFIAQAIVAPEPERLARVFAELIPHLP